MISVLVHGNMKQTHCVALVEAQKTHNDVLSLILPNEKGHSQFKGKNADVSDLLKIGAEDGVAHKLWEVKPRATYVPGDRQRKEAMLKLSVFFKHKDAMLNALQPMLEKRWLLIENMRVRDPMATIEVEHVFREYNVKADGLANEAIDSYVSEVHVAGVVVNDRWMD